MTATLLESTDARPSPRNGAAARRLRASMAAVRVSFNWFGTRKALSPEQLARAAEAFDAQGPCLSAGKKILDTKHPAFRAVTAVRGQVGAYWRGLTVPFPEPGVRLIPHDRVPGFDQRMIGFRAELRHAVAGLDRHYDELRRAAESRLGSLFDPTDYPADLPSLFGLEWDYPNVEPPDYLVRLAPSLYEAESARVADRFQEAVRLAEAAFLEEFARLVGHLTERISGTGEGGRPKVFRDGAVENLTEFFNRFRSLSVRSDEQLEALVAEAQRAVRGVAPQDLRDNESLRRDLSTRLSRVRSELDGMLVDRPRRRILRTAEPTTGGGA